MSPLIEIKNVPIEIEMKISHAELKYTRGTADLEISKDPGKGMQIKSKPIKVNMDTFQSQGFVIPAANTAAVAVDALTSGVYVAKVTTADAVKTVKFVK